MISILNIPSWVIIFGLPITWTIIIYVLIFQPGKKVVRISLAWWYWITNKNNVLAQERLKICVKCENRKGFVCGICLCPLQTKARLEEEVCPDPKGNRWQTKKPLPT